MVCNVEKLYELDMYDECRGIYTSQTPKKTPQSDLNSRDDNKLIELDYRLRIALRG